MGHLYLSVQYSINHFENLIHNMCRFPHILLLLAFLGYVNSQYYHNIERIGVQVGYSGCDCYMKLMICGGPDRICCMTDYLDSSHNDFVSGDYDIFSGSTLGDCNQFPLQSDRQLTTMTVYHEGLDGVDIDYWEIFYDDNIIEKCNDGNFYDNDDSYEISCV